MATKLTITVPDELAKRLEPHREHMNVSRVCAEALEAELKSREAHLASLVRYEEFKRMRSEAEAIREQMVAQNGRGWQKLAGDMQRMLKDISREIEQLEKQIPEGLRSVAVTAPEPPATELAAEKPAQMPEPAPVAEKQGQPAEPKPAADKGMHLPQLRSPLKKAPKPVEPKAVEPEPVELQPVVTE
jgi:post-segregation antitoxin (ccd killing protein)